MTYEYKIKKLSKQIVIIISEMLILILNIGSSHGFIWFREYPRIFMQKYILFGRFKVAINKTDRLETEDLNLIN